MAGRWLSKTAVYSNQWLGSEPLSHQGLFLEKDYGLYQEHSQDLPHYLTKGFSGGKEAANIRLTVFWEKEAADIGLTVLDVPHYIHHVKNPNYDIKNKRHRRHTVNCFFWKRHRQHTVNCFGCTPLYSPWILKPTTFDSFLFF